MWPTEQEACAVSQHPARQQQRIHPSESSCQSVRGLAGCQEEVSETKKAHIQILAYAICSLYTEHLCFCFSRDFLNSLRLYRTYYGGLADQLCVSELASGDGLPCWNGTDMVKRYVLKMADKFNKCLSR